jgi:hypothetical protein
MSNYNDRGERMAGLILSIIETYGKPMSEPLMKIWDRALEKYDIDAIEDAFMSHISDPVKSAHPPKPGDLILHITGTKRDRAATASSKLQQAIRCATASTGVTFDDPLINLTILHLGGWVGCYYSMCDAEKASEYVDSFIKTYERFSTNAAPQHPAYLPGRNDDGTFIPVGENEGVRKVVMTGYDPKNPQITRFDPKQIGGPQ